MRENRKRDDLFKMVSLRGSNGKRRQILQCHARVRRKTLKQNTGEDGWMDMTLCEPVCMGYQE